MNKLLQASDRSQSSQDVCFVNMPLSGLERPSIALGQLQALLSGAGISTISIYANLWFAEYFGLELSRVLQTVPPEDALVDWLFGAAAFPDFSPDHDRYLALMEKKAPQLGRAGITSEILLDLRGKMQAFTDWTADKILRRSPRIVGCTSTFQQHVPALALLRRIKEIAPDVVTMLGGANCETTMGQTTHCHFTWVDYVVSGEADSFIVPFIQDVLDTGCEIEAENLPFGVMGPIHRLSGYPVTDQGDGVPRAITQDARNLPLPDYDDYFEELRQFLYSSVIEPGLPMEFSRGCWWGAKSHCTFCGLNGGSMAYRARAPETVVSDMTALTSRYNVDRVEAVDNIMDLRYFKTVLPELTEREKPFRLFFETKANLKKDQVKALADAGVIWIQPGIESLDGRILTLMGKGCTAAQNIMLLKWCRQFGVRASWSIISHFPGEEDSWYETMAELVPALTHLQPGNMVPLRFDRYSPYFTRPQAYKLKLKPAERYRYAYPLPDEHLFRQVYFFENEADTGPADRPGIKAMRTAMTNWLKAWRNGPPPVFSMTATQEALILEDSRPGGVTTRLTGLHRSVLELSDDGPSEHQVIKTLTGTGHTEEEVREVMADLEAQKFLIRIDSRIIGLALTAPHQPVPLPSAFPGGSIASGRDKLGTLLAAF